MKQWFAVAALLCSVALSLPAAAQLQHFGYVFNGEDDASLNATKGFTNFAHTVAETPQDAAFLAKVNNINAKGLRATIDLGKIFWCGTNYNYLCSDWQTRWNQWKTYNASILTSTKVLAVTVRDEPLLYGASLNDVETAAAYIKSDPNLSWIKIWNIEAACKVVHDNCGSYPFDNGFARVTTSLPSVDWVGIAMYAIDPVTDQTFLTARDMFRNKFPGKKWMYIADGFWIGMHTDSFGAGNYTFMETIAQRWYDVARTDANAVLFGFYLWPSNPSAGEIGSRDFPLNVLAKQVAIGRLITGKTRAQTSLPIGRLEDIPDGTGQAYGYACDPDGAPGENPQIDLYMNGNYLTTASYPSRTDYVANAQCPMGIAFRFRMYLPIGSAGQNITAVARDLDSGSVTLQSNCFENPACVWYW